MRFRIIELLAIVSVIGLACVSLKQSDQMFETIFFSLTLVTVLTSILLAVGRNGGSRAFWAGFAISSLSYLGFAHVPDADKMVPRHNGPEITTQLLRHGLNWMHSDTYDTTFTSQSGGFFSVGDDPFAFLPDDDALSTYILTATDDQAMDNESREPYPRNLSFVRGSGQRIIPDGRSVSFMRIGHSCWALFLGWIGGHFTQVVYARSRRDRTSG